jgi:hypothetical protein
MYVCMYERERYKSSAGNTTASEPRTTHLFLMNSTHHLKKTEVHTITLLCYIVLLELWCIVSSNPLYTQCYVQVLLVQVLLVQVLCTGAISTGAISTGAISTAVHGCYDVYRCYGRVHSDTVF